MLRAYLASLTLYFVNIALLFLCMVVFGTFIRVAGMGLFPRQGLIIGGTNFYEIDRETFNIKGSCAVEDGESSGCGNVKSKKDRKKPWKE
jgi:hypothetical protein